MARVFDIATRLAGRLRRRATNRALPRFWRNDRGNVAVIFGITVVPMMSLMGAAIDYTQASTLRTRLQAMQDMAVLSALSKIKAQVPASQAQTDAIAFFNAQTASKGISANIALEVTDVGNQRSVTSTFTSVMPTNFMKIAGYPQMTVSNTSKGALTLPSYIDFYLLLDNTPSMGLGATPADIAALQANTPDTCAFACHDLSNSNSYYKMAKTKGITLRIDVVRQATQKLTDTATETATFANQFRMAVYTFGSSCTSLGVTSVAPLTSSMSSVKSSANGIDLMSIPYQGYADDQCTDFGQAFTAMNAVVPNSGPGTAANPQKFLFYVSDGVADANNPANCKKPLSNGTRCQEPLNPAVCKALKDRGVTIAVLYTTYLPVVNSWYESWIAPFRTEIPTNMQTCASPGFYFEVSPSQGISDAMNALFRKAVSKARLTS